MCGFARILRMGVAGSLALILLFVAQPAWALVIADTFGPNNSFQCCGGYVIEGGVQEIGVPFTLATRVVTDEFDVAATGSNLLLSIFADQNGVPGGTAIRDISFSGNGFVSLVAHIPLAAGNYWLVMSDPLGVEATWNHNDLGLNGTIAVNQFTDAFGNFLPIGWHEVNDVLPAYAILARPVDEPASLSIFVLGILIVVIARQVVSRVAPT